jgi:CubicO group peptidase (beta-lactamase class C family)
MFRRAFLAYIGGLFGLSGVTLGRSVSAAPLPTFPGDKLNAFISSNPFYGVVMRGQAGRIDHIQAVGFANIEQHIGFRGDTACCVASISKWLTALAVLRLVDRGVLSLDAPLTRYLPYFRKDTGDAVQLRHLLCNASGIPNQFITMVRADPSLLQAPMDTETAIRRFCQGDALFQPMERFDYVLTNWIIVQGILEKVTGEPFQTLMARLVLEPLGLRQTRADAAYVSAPDTAVSYRSINPPERREQSQKSFMVASGGYYSTAADLLRGAHRALDGNFLSAASRQALLSPLIDEYALGGRVKLLRVDGQLRPYAWETGNSLGFRSVLAHRLDTAETLVILNNTGLSQKMLDDLAIDLLGAARPV